MNAMMPASPWKHQGSAIISAMLVAAVAAAAATGMLATQSLWRQESTLAGDLTQCRYAARAGVAWAASILYLDERTSPVDHLGEPWATPLSPTPMEGATVSGVMHDLQGRYNINNLVRGGVALPGEVARYRRLLTVLDLPPALADTLADWIDADYVTISDEGAEDSYYATQPQGVRTAGRAIADITELLNVKGYNAAVLATLAPYISALPSSTPINVNTAPPPVLMLAAPALTLDDATRLSVLRDQSWFRDLADFQRRLPAQSGLVDMSTVSVNSNHFAVSAQVKCGDTHVRLHGILRRSGNALPVTIHQRFD